MLTSAKVKKFLRWQRIDEALHDHFSTTKTFFSKIATIVLSEGLTFFLTMGSMRSETK